MESSLDALLYRVLLGDADFGEEFNNEYQNFAIQRAASLVDGQNDFQKIQKHELRLRLAGHLTPKEALDHNPQQRKSRHRLIREHLVRNFHFDEDDADDLSREISKMLSRWEEDRNSVTSFRDRLLDKQNNRCAHCHVKFNSKPKTAENLDEYKPYHPKSNLRCTPEVDHIRSISTFGTNKIENLQVLCRLCNQGKGSGLGIGADVEISHAGKPIETVPWNHRAKMCYYVIRRCSKSCSICGSSSRELTIRPIISSGAYVRSNLLSVCVCCIEWG